jgi:hypothetical protein
MDSLTSQMRFTTQMVMSDSYPNDTHLTTQMTTPGGQNQMTPLTTPDDNPDDNLMIKQMTTTKYAIPRKHLKKKQFFILNFM